MAISDVFRKAFNKWPSSTPNHHYNLNGEFTSPQKQQSRRDLDDGRMISHSHSHTFNTYTPNEEPPRGRPLFRFSSKREKDRLSNDEVFDDVPYANEVKTYAKTKSKSRFEKEKEKFEKAWVKSQTKNRKVDRPPKKPHMAGMESFSWDGSASGGSGVGGNRDGDDGDGDESDVSPGNTRRNSRVDPRRNSRVDGEPVVPRCPVKAYYPYDYEYEYRGRPSGSAFLDGQGQFEREFERKMERRREFERMRDFDRKREFEKCRGLERIVL